MTTIDSPDQRVLTLGSVNPENGSASVSANIVYPFATIVKMTASGVITKTAQKPLYYWYQAYPSGTQSFQAAGDAFVTTLYLWDNRSFGFTSGPAYALIRAGETITSASRAMKSNEVWNPGCGPTWNQCYLYCGGWYPPSCFQFAGDAGAVNIERLEASMVVTVDSGGVPIAPGAQVTFAVRPNVTTLAGFSVPYQLDTAAWVPDPDSLGGEASELAVTGACSGGTDCRRTMNGSGTIRLVAHVNGKGFEYTQHFAMPVLTLRPLPEEFDNGDSVIFTPAWSDNTSILAGQVSGWTWAPDTGGVSTPCAAGTLPCGKRISAPGQMSVTVSRGGVSRSTKVHVGPKSEFTLSANRTTVSEGKLVRFTPKLDDDTTPAMRWRWVPAVPSADSASLCPDGATKCYRVMWATGRMWAYELSEGGDSASVDITVSAGDCLSLERKASSSLTTRGGTPSRSSSSLGSLSDLSGACAPDEEDDALNAEMAPIASQIATLLETDQYALLNVRCDQIPAWLELVNHSLPFSVSARLQSPDSGISTHGPAWVQSFQNAWGPRVNLDYYTVTVPIANLPIGYTAESYLNYMRTHINDFIDDPTVFNLYPGLVNEDLRWLNTPLGTVFSIVLDPVFQEDGTVVATAYATDQWIFSTARTPEDFYHPVSGNRRFGVVNNGNGTVTFYTRGADRISTMIDTGLDYLGLNVYAKGARVWESLQRNLQASLGPSAVRDSVIARPDYKQISAVFSGLAPVSSLACKP